MSHSWIKRFGGHKSGVDEHVGIALGPYSIALAHLEFKSNAWKQKCAVKVDLDDKCFLGKLSREQEELIVSVLTELVMEFRGRYMPIHVAIPSPIVTMRTLLFDVLPKVNSERSRLVRWRLAKELMEREKDIHCVYQESGKIEGMNAVSAWAMSVGWQESLTEILMKAQVIPWTVRSSGAYLWNRYYRHAVGKDGVAFVFVDDSSWTLLISDKNTCLRYYESKWRNKGGERIESLVLEIERKIMAYVHAGLHQSVVSVYGVCLTEDAAEFFDAMNKRLREPIGMLRLSEGIESFDSKSSHEGLGMMALAAAIGQ